MNRREFVVSSVATLGYLSVERLFAAQPSRALGVQVYTVRDQAEKDLPSVLRAIRDIGYEEVELYWNLYSRPAAALRGMLGDHGLRAPSGHFDYDGLDSKLDYARALGLKYVICPMLPNRMWNSVDEFKRAADQFNAWGEETNKLGMRFGFHNHNYEFRRLGDTTGFDMLVARTDPTLVCFEMDCYWIAQAGHDPVEMLKKHGSRIRLLHLKDRKPGFSPSQELGPAAEHFAEVGAGTLNWSAILGIAQQNGIDHLFVEQDTTDRPPLDALRISYKNLRSIV